MPTSTEKLLPTEILARATLSGNECAWQIADIPDVVEAARQANLINIGGQLQFRLPEGTCECYWVEVDTYKSVATNLSWQERVIRTAEIALRDYQALQTRFDFAAEGRSFAPLDRLVASGGDPAKFMCFVWYVQSEEEASIQ